MSRREAKAKVPLIPSKSGRNERMKGKNASDSAKSRRNEKIKGKVTLIPPKVGGMDK